MFFVHQMSSKCGNIILYHQLGVPLNIIYCLIPIKKYTSFTCSLAEFSYFEMGKISTPLHTPPALLPSRVPQRPGREMWCWKYNLDHPPAVAACLSTWLLAKSRCLGAVSTWQLHMTTSTVLNHPKGQIPLMVSLNHVKLPIFDWYFWPKTQRFCMVRPNWAYLVQSNFNFLTNALLLLLLLIFKPINLPPNDQEWTLHTAKKLGKICSSNYGLRGGYRNNFIFCMCLSI